MSARFGAAAAVTDYRDLEGLVDGVIIATPPALHHAMAKWFLQRGIHVLCEKPLAESLDQARELVDMARSHHAQLAVNQTRRLFPT
jgi:predicted dehydrogenase